MTFQNSGYLIITTFFDSVVCTANVMIRRGISVFSVGTMLKFDKTDAENATLKGLIAGLGKLFKENPAQGFSVAVVVSDQELVERLNGLVHKPLTGANKKELSELAALKHAHAITFHSNFNSIPSNNVLHGCVKGWSEGYGN